MVLSMSGLIAFLQLAKFLLSCPKSSRQHIGYLPSTRVTHSTKTWSTPISIPPALLEMVHLLWTTTVREELRQPQTFGIRIF